MEHRQEHIVKRRLKRFQRHIYRYRIRYTSFCIVLIGFIFLFNTPWNKEQEITLTDYEVSCVKSGRSGTEMHFNLKDGPSYHTFGFDKCHHYLSRVSGNPVTGVLHRAGWGIIKLKINGSSIHQAYGLVWVIILWWSGLVWSLGFVLIRKLKTRNKATKNRA